MMDLTQRPELKQKTTLSPHVYQGLSILAMPVVELQAVVEAEMIENPVLEVEEYADDEAPAEETREDLTSEDAAAWDEWLDQYEELERMDLSGPRDPNTESVAVDEFVGGAQTLEAYLLSQLAMMALSEDVSRGARAIVGLLDDDGYFVGDLEEIRRIADVSVESAAEALDAVQQLDPPGVGARTVKEALRIQAESLGVSSDLLSDIIENHLEDVAGNRYARIARSTGARESEVRMVVETLKSLNPRPAGAFSPGVAPSYVLPDVTVRRFDGDWLVIPNNEAVPMLKVNSRYRSMLRSGSSVDDDTRRYLRDKIKSAEAFIRNIDRRRDTVSQIARVIIEAQRDFFEDGRGDLRSLKLDDVAAELGVHLSTVSRGVTGKYMDTPYGLFELRHFFSGGYRTSTGMDVAATTVKKRLRELVQGEDVRHPLSDQALARALRDHGVDLARRTVAKYREELGIGPSWARKHR